MVFVIKKLGGTSFNIDLDTSKTLGDLRALIKTEIKCDAIRIVRKGQILTDDSIILSDLPQLSDKDVIVVLPVKSTTSQTQSTTQATTQAMTQATTQSTTQTTTQAVTATTPSTLPPSQLDFRQIYQRVIGREMNEYELLSSQLCNQIYVLLNKPEFIRNLALQTPIGKEMQEKYPQQFEEFTKDPNILMTICDIGETINMTNQHLPEQRNITGEMRIDFTAEEMSEIDELVMMTGMSKIEVMQMYIACGKNKEFTANNLFDQNQ